MEYILKLEDFEGPLSLLLELVKKEKMDIFTVSLEKIIDQYLDYIEHYKSLDLDIASDYLVMASDLLLIKSRKLLPREEELDEDELTEEKLREKLINYDFYLKMTEKLKDFKTKRENYYTKEAESIKEFLDSNLENNGEYNIYYLQELFTKLLSEKEPKLIKESLRKNKETVKNRIKDIKKTLNERKRVEFIELLNDDEKYTIVLNFLAILELANSKFLRISQKDNFSKIYCEVRE